MNTSNNTLALGFVGTDNVAPQEFKALLEDFIAAHWRSFRKSPVHFVFNVEPKFSDTLEALADWAVRRDYRVEFIGHDLTDEEVEKYLEGDNEHDLGPEVETHRYFADVLADTPHSRLILVGDPNEDDFTFEAFLAANEIGIVTRSLIDGLQLVELEGDTEEKPVDDFDFEDDDDVFDDDDGEDFDDITDEQETEAVLADEETMAALAEAEQEGTRVHTQESLEALADDDPSLFKQLMKEAGVTGRGVKQAQQIARYLGDQNLPDDKKLGKINELRGSLKDTKVAAEIDVEALLTGFEDLLSKMLKEIADALTKL